jgi:hypothetical protein
MLTQPNCYKAGQSMTPSSCRSSTSSKRHMTRQIRAESTALIFVMAFITFLGPEAWAEDGLILPSIEKSLPAASPTYQPALPSPGPPESQSPALDLQRPSSQPQAPSLFERWWFWTAIGAAAAATIVVIVLSSHGHAPPSTDLGNQEFHP